MYKKLFIHFFFIGLLLSACNQPASDKSEHKDHPANDVTVMDTAPAKNNLLGLVDNKKDPICGMPVTAGVSDTLHYQGKVLGFCAPECKAEFAAKPADYPVEFK